MNPDQPALLGALALASITLLGGALLVIRLREHLAEKPDPKWTYATQLDLDKLRAQVTQMQRDARADQGDIHQLVRKNAEHIAALIAQTEFHNQRLAEFSVKLDRLQSARCPTT